MGHLRTLWLITPAMGLLEPGLVASREWKILP
jgi:hypothetical protein